MTRRRSMGHLIRLLIAEHLIGWALAILPNPEANEFAEFLLRSWMAESLGMPGDPS